VNTPIKIQSGLLVILLASIVGCKQQANRVVDDYAERDSSFGKWNSGIQDYQNTWPDEFKIGSVPTKNEIARWDIDVRPDGVGLPKGSGTALKGATLYAAKCSSCHGKTGVEGPNDKLRPDSTGTNAIGNYWPYSTTIFDYVRRSMPFNAPGSLTDQEVYDITAYLLYINGLIKNTQEINSQTLVQIKMPAKDRYIDDDRKGGNEIK